MFTSFIMFNNNKLIFYSTKFFTSLLTLLIFHLSLAISNVSSSSLSIEELRIDLLKNYDVKVTPINEGGQTQVGVGITINYFTMDELRHTFIVDAWMRFAWRDPRLIFNSSSSNGTLVRFGFDEIWIPDVTLYNNANPTEIQHYGETHVLVSPDGSALWVPPAHFTSYCEMDLTSWPYDKQTCELVFGSWTHHGEEIDLYFIQKPNDTEVNSENGFEFESLQNYVNNSEWSLIKSLVQRNVKFYDGVPEQYVDLTFTFTLQRISPTYTAVFVVPIILIAIINMMIFLLPPSCEQRLIVGLTEFFLICIYLLYFQSKIPALGNHLPMLVVAYVVTLIFVSISFAISVTVIHLTKALRASSPPYILKVICNTYLASLLGLGYLLPFVSKTHNRLDERVEMHANNEIESRNRQNNEYGPQEVKEDVFYSNNEAPYMMNANWILIASIIDRISFISYFFVNVIIFITCIL